jgi:hypothetical protein
VVTLSARSTFAFSSLSRAGFVDGSDFSRCAALVLRCSCALFLLSLLLPFSDARVYPHRSDGSWLGFGSNYNGQLGVGDKYEFKSPIWYSPTAITALGTGTVESCALGILSHHTVCKKYVCIPSVSRFLCCSLLLWCAAAVHVSFRPIRTRLYIHTGAMAHGSALDLMPMASSASAIW